LDEDKEFRIFIDVLLEEMGYFNKGMFFIPEDE